jgi:hypothetical protein
MKHRYAILVAALVLAACDGATPKKTTVTALALTCAAPFTRDASAASLADAFGAANVTEQTIDGPEGEQLRATVLFANDPSRRVEVLWWDEAARRGLANASIQSPNTVWRGPGDLAVGASLDDVAGANGGPFDIAGFGWDYGGVVLDWKDGRLAQTPDQPCTVQMQFNPAPDAPEGAEEKVLGDSPFSSDSAEVRALRPRIWRMSIGYPSPAP